MFLMYVSSVLDVLNVCCNYFILMLQKQIKDVTHVVFVASVSEACCKCLFKIFHLSSTYVAILFYLDVTSCFTHTLQQYVPIVSILYCSKWFHVASRNFRYFVCFTHMLQVHIPNVSSMFRRMFHSNIFHVEVFYVVRPEASRG
jgi:hypothetical protein